MLTWKQQQDPPTPHHKSNSNALSLPPAWPPPRIHPQPHGHPNRNRHSPERRRIAPAPIAQYVINIALAHAHVIRTPLIHVSVNSTPQRRPRRRRHGQYSPVGAEILDAPDDADDDGGQAEDGAVASADEGGDEGEAGGVVLDEAGGEEELAEGEEEGKGEQEGDARDGEAAPGLGGAGRRRCWRGFPGLGGGSVLGRSGRGCRLACR